MPSALVSEVLVFWIGLCLRQGFTCSIGGDYVTWEHFFWLLLKTSYLYTSNTSYLDSISPTLSTTTKLPKSPKNHKIQFMPFCIDPIESLQLSNHWFHFALSYTYKTHSLFLVLWLLENTTWSTTILFVENNLDRCSIHSNKSIKIAIELMKITPFYSAIIINYNFILLL